MNLANHSNLTIYYFHNIYRQNNKYSIYMFVHLMSKRKPPVIHVFSATLSISIFVPQNEAYDDTRRSCRNYYVLQGTQSNL